jgi:hypothetical protein
MPLMRAPDNPWDRRRHVRRTAVSSERGLCTATGRLHPASGPLPETPHTRRGFRRATWALAHPELMDMAVHHGQSAAWPRPRRLGRAAGIDQHAAVSFTLS